MRFFHWTRLLAESGSSRQTVSAMPPAMRLRSRSTLRNCRPTKRSGLVTRHEWLP